jgi:hypothetical protein
VDNLRHALGLLRALNASARHVRKQKVCLANLHHKTSVAERLRLLDLGIVISRTPGVNAYRLRSSSSGLTPARARRTASGDGRYDRPAAPDRFRVRGVSPGFGWPAGPSEARLCASALSVGTQEPRKVARDPNAEIRSHVRCPTACNRNNASQAPIRVVPGQYLLALTSRNPTRFAVFFARIPPKSFSIQSAAALLYWSLSMRSTAWRHHSCGLATR